MNVRIFPTLILLICLSLGPAFGQNSDLQQELNKLQTAVERTVGMLHLLPDITDQNFKMTIEAKIKTLRDKLEEARHFAQNHQAVRARMAIRQAYSILSQIEVFIQQHPVLKIKYQEQLDRRIQRAEEVLENHRSREGLNLLNRAKFYRQKAFSLFREGRTFAAMEYYRLAMHFADEVLKLTDLQKSPTDEDHWRRLYLDTELLLERARTLVAQRDQSRQIHSLLTKAEIEMQEVRRLYERKNYTAAQQRLLTINRAVYRILDLAEDTPRDEIEKLRLDLQSLRLSLVNIDAELSRADLPAGKRLYHRAEMLANEVERLMHQGKIRLAQRNLFFANQILARLYRLLDSSTTDQPQQLEFQLARTEQNIAGLRSQRAEWDPDQKFVQMIESNFGKARSAFQGGDYPTAAVYLRLTNQLILQFNRMQLRDATSAVEKGIVQQELQRLADMLNRFEEGGNLDLEASVHYQNAKYLYQLAEKAFDENNWMISRELTQLAINLLTQ